MFSGHCTKSSWLHSTTLHARGTVAPRPTEWSCIIARQLWTEDSFVTVRDNDVRRLHPTTPARSYNPPFIKRFQHSLLAHHSYAHLFTLHFSRVTNTWLTISLFFGGHRVQISHKSTWWAQPIQLAADSTPKPLCNWVRVWTLSTRHLMKR